MPRRARARLPGCQGRSRSPLPSLPGAQVAVEPSGCLCTDCDRGVLGSRPEALTALARRLAPQPRDAARRCARRKREGERERERGGEGGRERERGGAGDSDRQSQVGWEGLTDVRDRGFKMKRRGVTHGLSLFPEPAGEGRGEGVTRVSCCCQQSCPDAQKPLLTARAKPPTNKQTKNGCTNK